MTDDFGRGERIVRVRTMEAKSRVYALSAVMRPTFENEAMIDAFFGSFSEK